MTKSEELKKISDSLLQLKQNSRLNLISTETKSKITTGNLTLTNKKFKSFWVKIHLWEMKLEMLKRTWDFQLHKSENLPMNSRSLVMKMKIWREDSNKLVAMPIKKLLNMKVELLCFHKNLKDWIVLLRKRTTRSGLLEDKFNKPKKTSDFQMHNKINSIWNWTNTKLNCRSAMNNLRLTDRKFKRWWLRITVLAIRWEMPKKTWDSQHLKLVSSTTN